MGKTNPGAKLNLLWEQLRPMDGFSPLLQVSLIQVQPW